MSRKDAENPAAYRRYQQVVEPSNRLPKQPQPTPVIVEDRLSIWTVVPPGAAAQLDATYAALRLQTFANWQWFIQAARQEQLQHLTDQDSRIVYGQPVGDYIVELRPGDQLAPVALERVALALHNEPGVDALYTDCDRIDDNGQRCRPWFKPDWSPEMMFSCDLFEPLCVFRRELLHPSSDLHYHLATHAKHIVHLPQVLVHTRELRGASPSAVVDYARQRGLSDPQMSSGFVRWQPKQKQRVSIIIPSRDHASVLAACLDGLFAQTSYENFQVILIDTGSKQSETYQLYERYRQEPRCRIVSYADPFNFSRVCNRGTQFADGDLFLFLNNDTQVLHHDWLDLLAQWFELPGVGVVGPKLLYPNGRIQHAGVIVGMSGLAGHVFAGESAGVESAFGSDNWYRNYLAVTGACMLIAREVFEQVNGFDEGYTLAFSDVDLCLSVYERGYRIVYTPHVRLLHHEAATRGRRIPRQDFLRANTRWRKWLDAGDPYYNPNLTYRSQYPALIRDTSDTPQQVNTLVMRRLPNQPFITE